MYFNNSFIKDFLLKPASSAIDLRTSGTTSQLTAGQIGLYNTPQNGIIGNAISAGQAGGVTIASGSWHTVDKIAPFWGGLKESIKSKTINWNRVTRFIKETAQTPQNQIVSFGWDQTISGATSSVGPAFFCGTPYYFFIQAQGSPALWFLNKQMYKQLDAFGGCCGTDCSSGCTSTYADAASVMLQWKDVLSQDPYWPSFVTPQVFINVSGAKTEVYSAYDHSLDSTKTTYVPNTANPISVVASFQLTVAYAETKFGTCTFSITDHYEVEPLIIQGSLVTQTADPCAVNTTINTSVPNMYTQIQAPLQVRGLGEAVVRNLLMTARYRQESFPDNIFADSLRMREIENVTTLSDAGLATLYDSIMLIHTISRPYNPSGVSDNDQYALRFYVPTGTSTTAFTTLIAACLTAAGSPVTLETI